MSILSVAVIYFLSFWTVLFAVLPWKQKHEQDRVVGCVQSAPDDPLLRKKVIATALLSVVITIGACYLIEINIVDFYKIANEMAAEDNLL